jgi:predicted nuclease of predicted toxin-antitoxin system
MSWWKAALYDTCSLITLDKLLQDRPSLSRWFPKKFLALEVSLSAEQMYEETAERLKEIVEICPLPTPTELAGLLSSAGLSKALADVDKLVFATAVHSDLVVVTGDKRLAKAVQQRGLEVGNIALILQELVTTKKLKSSAVEKMLQDLADRKDYLLGIPKPTWNDLKDYTFPD